MEVPIPPDAEGVVITNITSHMGGVFLWETGYPALPIPTRPDTPSSAATAAAALTHNRRQALAGGCGHKLVMVMESLLVMVPRRPLPPSVSAVLIFPD